MKQRLQAWGNAKVVEIAGCFIMNKDGAFLLLQRHPDDLGGGKWGVPAGRLEPGEQARHGMLREVFEETGLSLTETTPLGVHTVTMPHGTVRMTSFRATVPNGTSITLDPEEHQEYRWILAGNILTTKGIIWGVPTIMHDFGLLHDFDTDPTLTDGSRVVLVSKN